MRIKGDCGVQSVEGIERNGLLWVSWSRQSLGQIRLVAVKERRQRRMIDAEVETGLRLGEKVLRFGTVHEPGVKRKLTDVTA